MTEKTLKILKENEISHVELYIQLNYLNKLKHESSQYLSLKNPFSESPKEHEESERCMDQESRIQYHREAESSRSS